MAGLVELPINSVYCGATIIARNYAISAAHCLTNRNITDLVLLVGDQDYSTGTPLVHSNSYFLIFLIIFFYIGDDTDYAAVYQISTIIEHPGYVSEQNLNDITILKTSTLMTFNEGVGAVCLPFKYVPACQPSGMQKCIYII